jgi:hypothetical protein
MNINKIDKGEFEIHKEPFTTGKTKELYKII